MKNILIYGCGYWGRRILEPLLKKYEYRVLAYIDRNLNDSQFGGIPIKSFEEIFDYDFDLIFVSIDDYREAKIIEMSLKGLGIEEEKIKLVCYTPEYIELFSDQRSEFIKDMARWIQENHIEGNVAECGVYRGDSAKFINKYFSDRKLYLFDTFEGFEHEDLDYEIENLSEGFNDSFFNEDIFKDTSVDIVKRKMSKVENVMIKKGFFPETAADIEDSFCFVNLDMDLYTPMLSGLRFFWNKMEKGGCILLHDYFHDGLQGVKKAVDDFECENNITLNKMPIGDHISLAIIK